MTRRRVATRTTSADAPKLFVWGARTLFLGRALRLSAHRNAVAVLCAGLDGPFDIAIDPRHADAGYISCRTALIPPNTLHHLRCGDRMMAFLYVDAESDDFRRLVAAMRVPHERVGIELVSETGYLGALGALRDGRPWREARSDIVTALNLGENTPADERIGEALRCLREHPERPHRLVRLAQAAKLSPSRFLHLFKASTGVPFRRYKIWLRMGAAIHGLTAGRSLTDAALASGFASPSHFSAAFREMFGLAPSELAAARMTIHSSRSSVAAGF